MFQIPLKKIIPQYTNFYTTNQKFFIAIQQQNSYVGVDILQTFSDNDKVDYITIDGNIYTHKQIETRNGLVFMRMKKRILKK